MRLAELRDSRGMTQQDVADALETPVATYRKYEYETRQIPIPTLMSLADLYGVDLDYLVGREVTPEESRKMQLDTMYKMLNEEGKDLLITIVKVIVKSGDYLSI